MSLDAARFVFEGQKHSMLWLSGFGYIAIGATWIITGILTTPDPAFDWLSRYLGPTLSQPEWLALVWVGAGILQMLPILIPRNRRHQVVRHVAFGFGAAIFAPAPAGVEDSKEFLAATIHLFISPVRISALPPTAGCWSTPAAPVGATC